MSKLVWLKDFSVLLVVSLRARKYYILSWDNIVAIVQKDKKGTKLVTQLSVKQMPYQLTPLTRWKLDVMDTGLSRCSLG